MAIDQYVDEDYWGDDYAGDETVVVVAVYASIPLCAIPADRPVRHASVSPTRVPSISQTRRRC